MQTDNKIRMAREAAKRLPYITLILTAVALSIHIYHPLRPHLIYTRAALSDGDLWRLISCHWVHLNADHLLWSSMTFFFLGSVCEFIARARYVITLSISVIFIPIAIWLIKPDLEVYGGLSGLDCSLYSLLIALFIKREWHSQNWFWIICYTILIVLLPAKIIYEMSSGLTIFVNNIHTDMAPVPLSHLVGGLIGIAVGTSILGLKIKKSSAPIF